MDINHLTIEELEILIDASKKRIETLKKQQELSKKNDDSNTDKKPLYDNWIKQKW